MRRPWKEPSRPVRPETTSFVSLVDDDAHAAAPGELDDAAGGVEHRLLLVQVGQVGLGEDLQALLGVGAVEAHDQRQLEVELLRGGDDPLGDLVAAGDAAEDVEEDRRDLRVGGDHFQRVDDRLGLGAAAGVEEVGRRAARLGDDVEGRHAEPGAVGEDADVAVELDVGEALLLRHRLLRILDRVGDLGQVLVAEERVAVDRHLGVEGDDLAVGGDDQRVDLDQVRVLAARHLGQLHQHLGGLVADVLVEPGRVDDLPRGGGVERRGRVDVAL